jgi:hypothetical protein
LAREAAEKVGAKRCEFHPHATAMTRHKDEEYSSHKSPHANGMTRHWGDEYAHVSPIARRKVDDLDSLDEDFLRGKMADIRAPPLPDETPSRLSVWPPRVAKGLSRESRYTREEECWRELRVIRIL